MQEDISAALERLDACIEDKLWIDPESNPIGAAMLVYKYDVIVLITAYQQCKSALNERNGAS